MPDNSKLRKADRAKNDEFYTHISDIERELRHYKDFFKGKVVYCNCDDPYESHFFKYVALNFNILGLKKLISASYSPSPIAGVELSLFEDNKGKQYTITGKTAYKVIMTELKASEEEQTDPQKIQSIIRDRIGYLKGNGDFRSSECIELLKEADVVVTNPPFSLFRQYVAQLMEYNKKFIIVGNQNAIAYKEIFPLLKENKMWLGYGFQGNVGFFINTKYKDYAVSSQHKEGRIRVSGVMWFTNIDIDKRHETLDLYKEYTPEEFPKYDNYDAINVDKTGDIPIDYKGKMGVPITFLDKYNPDQFEIIDGIGRYSILNNEETKKAGLYLSMVNGKAKYFRVIIRLK